MYGQKDKYGQDVYDGDILEKENSKKHFLVKETIDGWKIKTFENLNSTLSIRYCKHYKVVGNKYKNPELLGYYNEESKENIQAKIVCCEIILDELKKKMRNK